MNLEHNRQVATEFFRRHDAGDPQGALDLLADDCQYWLAGQAGRNATGGRTHDKAGMAEIFRRMSDAMTGPLRMTVIGTVAEGEQVAVEAVSRGELKNGKVYEQAYHVLMTIRGGRIVRAREYMDTQHVQDIWYTR
ncbi:nuclear transport factor 2 family protein [Ramlibacter sp.]|uniref:nuclear transport factor 2 family protein n=1 Tax=Ramlibacter sp. TaxID=1917967 RepID=UPI0035B33B3E